MRLDSTISLGWILMLGGVGLVTVGIMVLIIYWLNRKPQYQPVPPPVRAQCRARAAAPPRRLTGRATRRSRSR